MKGRATREVANMRKANTTPQVFKTLPLISRCGPYFLVELSSESLSKDKARSSTCLLAAEVKKDDKLQVRHLLSELIKGTLSGKRSAYPKPKSKQKVKEYDYDERMIM